MARTFSEQKYCNSHIGLSNQIHYKLEISKGQHQGYISNYLPSALVPSSIKSFATLRNPLAEAK